MPRKNADEEHRRALRRSTTAIGSTATGIQDRRAVVGSLTHGYRAIRVLVKQNLGIE